MTTIDQDKQRRGRIQIILLAAVFFGPLLVAIGMYFFGDGEPINDGVNFGELVTPSVVLDDKQHFDTGLRGRWTLLLIMDGDCGDSCQKSLIDMRQIRLATGREIDRIERAVVTPAGPSILTDETRAQHPGLKVFDDTVAVTPALREALATLPPRQLYIMDPLGNVVLRYPMNPDRKGMLGDLKKLLKLSRIG